MSSLNEDSDFNDLVSYYEENCDKPMNKWLKVVKLFPNQGKQGITGLVSSLDGKKTFVFKLSQYINYLAQHELVVMKSLNSLGVFCPYFCKGVGLLPVEVEPDCRRAENPFNVKNKHPIEKNVLLMEHVENSTKFYNYIKSDRIPENIFYSTIKQVLMAITFAQRKKQFTHYDLHSNNIMMKKCNKNLVFLHVLDEENQYCVATNGYFPVIIDYGFSYVKDMNDGPLWPTLGHTHAGFTSDHFDPIADPKLFLIVTSGELHDNRKSEKSKILKNIVKNMFGRLKVSFREGWDNDLRESVSDIVLKMFKNYNSNSKLFDNYSAYCLDIIQTLVILPLQEQKYQEVDVPYKTFLNEFIKIENEIGDPFYNMYILKGIIDATRDVRVDYMNKNSREHALTYFRQSINERISKVAKWCRPKDVHYEKMLCGLLCLARGLEGVMHDAVKGQTLRKSAQYEKMPLENIEQIYTAIDVNIPDEYIYNEKTIVMIMNSHNETCGTFSLTGKQIEDINETESIYRGTELYQIYKDDHN